MTNQITLPCDAEGREIPLETKTLYSKDGKKLCVREFRFSKITERWIFDLIEADQEGRLRVRIYFTWQVYLEKPAPPDSWEKLLSDLHNTAEKASSSIYIAPCCAWFSGGDRRCDDCPANESPGVSCNVQLVNDISARIRKLRGEDE